MQPHGEGGYDAPESSGGLRGDALAQDVPLGGDDGGRSVVAARLDAQDEAAPWLMLSAVSRQAPTLMAGNNSASSMPKEEIWQHYILLEILEAVHLGIFKDLESLLLFAVRNVFCQLPS